MGLPPVGQPPEDNCCACLNAGKAAVMIKVGLGLESVVWLGFGLVLQLDHTSSVLYNWLLYLATVR